MSNRSTEGWTRDQWEDFAVGVMEHCTAGELATQFQRIDQEAEDRGNQIGLMQAVLLYASDPVAFEVWTHSIKPAEPTEPRKPEGA